ncbi:hypothetical protein AB0E70_03290 [Streptomyces murinus]|uniref:hypothetical protein n=1 Tax=Streptomyces murinus TaxID=33900 RepID=UPI001FC9C28A|nr:hypothetical protein [Streptomyces murinus]
MPHLAKKPLTKLTPAQVRTFMATLKGEEVGAATRFKVPRYCATLPTGPSVRRS